MAEHTAQPSTQHHRGDCPCGTTQDTPPGWCGLMHYGLGCRYTNTHLVDVPRCRGSAATIAVCLRCAARARWWLAEPRHRPKLHDTALLGPVLFIDDGTRNPIGNKPRHVPA